MEANERQEAAATPNVFPREAVGDEIHRSPPSYRGYRVEFLITRLAAAWLISRMLSNKLASFLLSYDLGVCFLGTLGFWLVRNFGLGSFRYWQCDLIVHGCSNGSNLEISPVGNIIAHELISRGLRCWLPDFMFLATELEKLANRADWFLLICTVLPQRLLAHVQVDKVDHVV